MKRVAYGVPVTMRTAKPRKLTTHAFGSNPPPGTGPGGRVDADMVRVQTQARRQLLRGSKE